MVGGFLKWKKILLYSLGVFELVIFFCLNLPMLEWQVCPTMSSISELGWGSIWSRLGASRSCFVSWRYHFTEIHCSRVSLLKTSRENLATLHRTSWPPEGNSCAIMSLQFYSSLWPLNLSKEWCVDLHTFLHGTKVKISLSTRWEFRASPSSPSPSSIIAEAKYIQEEGCSLHCQL